MIRKRRGIPTKSASAALSAAVVLLGAARAQAAPPPPARPAASSSAAPAKSAGTEPLAVEEASNHFKRGLRLFDEGDYTLALVEFERAYQLAPNYRALYNIAQVNMQLGRYADAARTFEKYLNDGGSGIAPPRVAEIQKTLTELKLRTAVVEVTTNVAGAEVTLDGKPVDPSSLRGPMEIDAGEHTLRAMAPGYEIALRTVTLAGGDHASVRLQLAPLSLGRAAEAPPPTHAHAVFWPGFVATGALAAGAIVSGAVMLDARSRLAQLENTPSDAASAATDAAQRASAANTANTAALTADVLTGLAVVAGGVSLYLSLRPEHPLKSPTLAISLQQVRLSVPF